MKKMIIAVCLVGLISTAAFAQAPAKQAPVKTEQATAKPHHKKTGKATHKVHKKHKAEAKKAAVTASKSN